MALCHDYHRKLHYTDNHELTHLDGEAQRLSKAHRKRNPYDESE